MGTRTSAFVALTCLLVIGLLAGTGGESAEPRRTGTPAVTPKAAAGDWPWWRGPTLDGKSADRNVATTWSATENVVWKTKVPGRGHSSPCVCGDRVFLTTADEEAHKQFVLAFERTTGNPLWTPLAHEAAFTRKNAKNSHASATPACDGQRLYSVFLNADGLHVTATDQGGKILWQTRAGAFQSEHGYGSSPLLYKSLVLVNGDSLKGSFQAALDAATGKVVWKVDRKVTGRHGNYATAAVATLAGKPQLILTGMSEVSSLDPDTGKLLWSCAGPAEVTACTAACGDGVVFATGGFPEKELLAVRADGSGEVTKSHVLWRTNRGVTYVPSPLYHDGRLFVVADGGVTTCFEAATGKQLWQDRLAGAFTSSPILVGDLVYATSEAGKTFVFKAGPKFELLASNDLGEGVLATPAVCGGQVFLRTEQHLYCLGNPVGVKRE
jgi:outer membrane protein assembly factor BamB